MLNKEIMYYWVIKKNNEQSFKEYTVRFKDKTKYLNRYYSYLISTSYQIKRDTSISHFRWKYYSAEGG